MSITPQLSVESLMQGRERIRFRQLKFVLETQLGIPVPPPKSICISEAIGVALMVIGIVAAIVLFFISRQSPLEFSAQAVTCGYYLSIGAAATGILLFSISKLMWKYTKNQFVDKKCVENTLKEIQAKCTEAQHDPDIDSSLRQDARAILQLIKV